MNGETVNEAVAKIMGHGPVIGNPEVIKLFEGALADAKKGLIHSVAVIFVTGPGGIQVAMTGGSQMEFVVGSEMLKAAALGSMTTKRGGSPIIKAGHG